MRNSWKSILGSLGGLVLLVFAMILIDDWREREFRKTIENHIMHVQRLDKWLNEAFLKSRQSSIKNYDFIRIFQKRIQAGINSLKSTELYKKNDAVKERVGHLESRFQEKFELLDSYRRQHSVITNSLIYISYLPESKKTSLSSKNHSLLVNASMASYRYFLNPNDSEKSTLTSLLQSFENKEDSLSLTTKVHLKLVLDNTISLSSVVESFLNVDTEGAVSALHNEDREHLAEASKIAGYMNGAFSLLIILTFLVISYLLLKQLRKEEALRKELDQQKAMTANTSKMAALGEMAGQVAHEINTPLGTLTLISNMLMSRLEEENLPPQFLNDQLTLLLRVVDSIAKIVASMKNFARSGSGEQMGEISISNILAEVQLLTGQKVKNCGAHFQVKSQIDLNEKIQCRTFQVVQVIINLLGNALHAVEKSDIREIEFEITKVDDLFKFRMTDSGPGIPESIRAKIFEPQFTTKPAGQGTGIGLSISKNIIQNHGGDLYLDNSESGASFVFTIPEEPKLLDTAA